MIRDDEEEDSVKKSFFRMPGQMFSGKKITELSERKKKSNKDKI